MPSLYVLVDEVLQLDALLDESGGELTPDIEQWREDHAIAFTSKIDNFVQYIKVMKADMQILETEEKNLYARRKTMDRKVHWLKGMLKWAMEVMGHQRLRGTYGSVTLQQPGGVAPLILDVPEDGPVPEAYQRVTVTWDKEKLRADVAAGKADALLLAHLGEREQILVIR